MCRSIELEPLLLVLGGACSKLDWLMMVESERLVLDVVAGKNWFSGTCSVISYSRSHRSGTL